MINGGADVLPSSGKIGLTFNTLIVILIRKCIIFQTSQPLYMKRALAVKFIVILSHILPMFEAVYSDILIL